MKTITLVAYNRLDYLAEVYRSIATAQAACPFDHLYISIDPSDKLEAVLDLVKERFMPTTVIVNPTRLGINFNNKAILDHVFFTTSQFNVHVEDDVVLSPDALNLANEFFYEWSETHAFIEFFSRMREDLPPSQLVVHHAFNPWGWGCSSDIYRRFVSPGWTQDPGLLWDLNLHRVMRENGLTSLRPMVSRAKHIGRLHGINNTPEYFDEHLTGFNFNQAPYSGRYRIVS